MLKKQFIIKILVTIFWSCVINTRSIHRPTDPLMPEIITRWKNEKETFHLKSYYLEYQSLFTKFDKEYLMSHFLPKDEIIYRNDKEKSVSGEILSNLIENLLNEIYKRKSKFKDFKILKNKDFNINTSSGLLILKFKNYPFVVKIFMENPESFVKPFSKGWQPSVFFVMGGGINRYLSGFTRIKNREAIKNQLASNPKLNSKIDLPRKWFWLPKDTRWFELCGKNISQKEDLCMLLPSVYVLIADAINADKNFTLLNKENREFALEVSNYLDNKLDPHIDNFMIEKETKKAIIVDTEHFPTMVGLKEPVKYDNYVSWYSKLSFKCFKDKFCRSKNYNKKIQSKDNKIKTLEI